MAKVNWRLMYTLAPNFEANVYISPKLQTWRLMCTLSPNLETKVNVNKKRKPDKINFFYLCAKISAISDSFSVKTEIETRIFFIFVTVVFCKT